MSYDGYFFILLHLHFCIIFTLHVIGQYVLPHYMQICYGYLIVY